MRDLAKSRLLTNAKDLTVLVYAATDGMPARERFGLTGQARRAAVSIAANVAEGLGRGTPGDLERHLRIASGSAAELVVLLDLARGLHGVDTTEVDPKLRHVRRQITLLTQQVRAEREGRVSQAPRLGSRE